MLVLQRRWGRSLARAYPRWIKAVTKLTEKWAKHERTSPPPHAPPAQSPEPSPRYLLTMWGACYQADPFIHSTQGNLLYLKIYKKGGPCFGCYNWSVAHEGIHQYQNFKVDWVVLPSGNVWIWIWCFLCINLILHVDRTLLVLYSLRKNSNKELLSYYAQKIKAHSAAIL